MKPLHLLATVALIGLAGCSRTNDFTPPPGASGEENFKAACAGCHESKGAYTFELGEDMKDKSAIATKIAKGSLAMPGFPNIQGQALIDLTSYVQLQDKVE
jgi:cytochrome c551